MPELPEVETVKNGIAKFIGNAEILQVTVRNRKFRETIPEDFAASVCGGRISSYRRQGKYIVIELDNGRSIIWHLGMSGRIKTADSEPSEQKHDHVLIKTSAGWLIFHDPRRFGILTVCPTGRLAEHPYFAKMGPDPFDPLLTADYLFEQLGKRRTSVKQALLDQEMIAGIGNIYASEILFRAGILPTRPAGEISRQECGPLLESIREILKQAIANGGSTLHDYHRPDGSLGYFQNLHCVYNKAGKPCPGCTCAAGHDDGGIRKIVQGGRSTFYCPVKQK